MNRILIGIFFIGIMGYQQVYAENCYKPRVISSLNNVVIYDCGSKSTGGSQPTKVCVENYCTETLSSPEYQIKIDGLELSIAYEALKRHDSTNAQLGQVVTVLNTLNQRFDTLNGEMAAYRAVVEKQVLDAKADMMKRIELIPADLMWDPDAYKILKAKLEKDLAEVFAPKTEP